MFFYLKSPAIISKKLSKKMHNKEIKLLDKLPYSWGKNKKYLEKNLMKTIRLLISLMAPERKDSLNLKGLYQLMNSEINLKIIIISLFNNFITHWFKSSRLFIRVYISPILTNVNVNFIDLNERWIFRIKKYHNRRFFNKLNQRELKKSRNTKIYSIKI